MAKPLITPLHTALAHPTRSWTMPPSPSTVLRLSSASFLDGIITRDGVPAYAVETAHGATSLARCTPAGLHEFAQVHWPQTRDAGTYVRLGACSHQPEHAVLRRPAAFGASRKFRVPGRTAAGAANVAYKWRHVDSRDTWECAAACGAPVAVYEPAVLTSAARIRLYKPFADDDALVDMLVLTALLITSAPDEWRAVPTPFRQHQHHHPQQPGALPRYSLLAAEFDTPARQPTKLERERSLRRVRSLAPSASSSASSAFSSAPSSPASRRAPLPSLNTSLSSVMSMSSHASSPSPVTSPEEDSPAWSSRFASDKLLPEYALAADTERPPPYEHHQWTVRVPVRAYASKR